MKNEYLISAKKLYKNLFLNFLVLLAPFILSTCVSALLLYFFNGEIDTHQRILISIVFDFVFIVSLYFLHRIKDKDSFSKLWGNLRNIKLIPIIFILVITVYLCFEALMYVILGQQIIEYNPNIDIRLLGTAFFMVIVGAIAEELIFRGYLLRTIYSYTNSTIISILLSSILFAAVHIGKNYDDTYSLVSIFITGVILSIIVVKTGSLKLVVIIHILHNLRHFIFLNEEYSIFKRLYAYDSSVFELIYESLQVIIICLLILTSFKIIMKMQESSENLEIKK